MKFREEKLRISQLNDLTKKHTAYGSFAEMCRNIPTLKPSNNDNWIKQEEIQMLRDEYFGATMTEAGR